MSRSSTWCRCSLSLVQGRPAAALSAEGAVESSSPHSAASACTRHSESVFCCAIRTCSAGGRACARVCNAEFDAEDC